MHNSPRPRILLVKLSSFGDVIHALPTLEALRAAYPRGHITWLVESAYAPLLDGHPALDEVVPVPRVRFRQNLSSRELPALARLMRRLRAQPFDLVLDLQGLLKSAIWVALARSPRKVGYHGTREGSYLVLTERVAPYDPDAHAVRRYLHLAHYLGAPPAPPRFRLGFAGQINPDGLIPQAGARPLAVIHPGARWATKLWPTSAWARLADWLGREQGLAVALTGSQGDLELAEAIIGQAATPILNLAGRTSLPELAAVYRQAVLAVTTDTGPMHLAAALGTRVAAVFGPTAPWRTGPFGEGHEMVRLGLDCSPCFRRHCPEPRCLTELPLVAVQTACEKILSYRRVN
jgi:lipopolysaccharide heptosyltransferase I